MNHKNKYGQYMTPEMVTSFMAGLIEHDKNSTCLEPCCGSGAFLNELKRRGFKNINAYEIDESIIPNGFNISNQSFISADIKDKYDVIIGNPPYIRWKNLENNLKAELKEADIWNNYCNSLCDYSAPFIIKSVELLKENGELIFITTDYWFSTTHAAKIRNYILENGYISDIFSFNETPIFENVKASFVIFRFVKNKYIKPKINVTKFYTRKKISQNIFDDIISNKCGEKFSIPQFKNNTKWCLLNEEENKIIEFYEKSCKKNILKDICDIGNGMVSGLDKAFQLPEGLQLDEFEKNNCIDVVKAKNLGLFVHGVSTKYIFLREKTDENLFQNKFSQFFHHLSPYKAALLKRYSYGKDLKYWEWAFLRNFSLFKKNTNKIFCPCKERITKKNRFRFSIVSPDYYPTQDVTALYLKPETEEDIRYVAALLNSRYVFKWLSNKGIRKGDIVEFSEAPLASVPYRKINFSDTEERNLHDKIVKLVDKYRKNQDIKILNDIDLCISELLEI